MKAQVQFKAESLQEAIDNQLTQWQNDNKVARLWKGDVSLWTGKDENQWLGWLHVFVSELNAIPQITTLAQELKAKGFQHLVLLGMGGSSLCPYMLEEIFGKLDGYPHLQVLDSTDPDQIRHLEKSLDLQKTFFIVSSKSGTTLEPNIFKDYFYQELQKALGRTDVGNCFIAITDPKTALEKQALTEKFKAVFHGIPSIGGRYSALSNFGMVPAGLMGMDVKKFLEPAIQMEQACGPEVLPRDNPGAILGIILGVCANHGKDKATLIVSPEIRSLGAWLEQLIAESTGKHGKGIIPIDNEPLGKPENYSRDRIFIYIRLSEAPDAKQDAFISAIEADNQLVVRLSLAKKEDLAAELFRFEIATACAGSVMGINPFDQPDVEDSKKRAIQLVDEFGQNRKLPKPTLILSENGLEFYTDEKNAAELNQKDAALLLQSHFDRIKPNDYFNISAFIEMSAEHTEILQACRTLVRDAKKVATCLGFGPRFLHSTGQAYKGGPNTGVFLQLTTDYENDIQVPNKAYTFGTVIQAQAQGDFEVLANRNRRVLRVHFKNGVASGLKSLHQLIERALHFNSTEN